MDKEMVQRIAQLKARGLWIDLSNMQAKIDDVINCTPTGETRNALTEVNILYLELMNKLYEVLERNPLQPGGRHAGRP